MKVDMVEREPVEPESAGPVRALPRADIADDACNRGRLSGRDVEVGDGEQARRAEEAVDPVEQRVVVGHHGEAVRHRHVVEAARLAVEALVDPCRQDELRRVLEQTAHVGPAAGRKALARDVEERPAKVEDVDGVE